MSFTTIWMEKWIELDTKAKLVFLSKSPDTWEIERKKGGSADITSEISAYNLTESRKITESEMVIWDRYNNLISAEEPSEDLLIALIDFYIKNNFPRVVTNTNFYDIFYDIYRFELENYADGNFVFYHGQSVDIGLANYAIYFAKKLHYTNRPPEKSSECKLYFNDNGSVYETASRKGEQMGLGRLESAHTSTMDWDPEIRSKLYSVNYSLIGNFEPMSAGECTLAVFLKNLNMSCGSNYIREEYIPGLTQSKEFALKQLFKRFDEFVKLNRVFGRIVAFVFPLEKIDYYVFNSKPGGTLSKDSIVSNIDFVNMPFNKFDKLQARVVGFNGDDTQIDVKIFETHANIIRDYRREIRNILREGEHTNRFDPDYYGMEDSGELRAYRW